MLHVCTRYQRGGSERRIRDIVHSLPELEHVLLVGEGSDERLAREQTGAERVEVLPGLVRPVSPVQDLAAARRLRARLRRERPGVLVTHQSKAGALGRLAARASGRVPVVHSLSMASFGPGYGRAEDAVFRRLERVLGRMTAAYCVVGQDLADAFAGLDVDPGRLHVVRSGVPLPTTSVTREQARRAVEERYGLPPGRPLLVYVGSLEPRKNVLHLPELLARAAPDGTLLVLGEGLQRAALEREVAARGLTGQVHLAGHVAEPGQVHTAMKAADAVVLLSSAEGLPQVLLQAAVLGTPFVAYDVDGVRELLGLGAAGERVPLGDLAAATAACARVVGLPAGEGAFDAGSWSPEEITRAYRRVFGQVLGRDLDRPATSHP